MSVDEDWRCVSGTGDGRQAGTTEVQQTGMAGWFCSWLEEGVGAIKIVFSFLLFTFLFIYSFFTFGRMLWGNDWE